MHVCVSQSGIKLKQFYPMTPLMSLAHDVFYSLLFHEEESWSVPLTQFYSDRGTCSKSETETWVEWKELGELCDLEGMPSQ